MRPMSCSGRPASGMVRPNTGQRQRTAASRGMSRSGTVAVQAAMRGGRPGTTRPYTASGRFVRLGTASLASRDASMFIDLSRMDMRKYAARPTLARALCEYLLHVDVQPKHALQLALEANKVAKGTDWWWLARAARCYYKLNMLREAEDMFRQAHKLHPMPESVIEMTKIWVRLDQPQRAIQKLQEELVCHPTCTVRLLALARIFESLCDFEECSKLYLQVLQLDPTNVEALACQGASYFYTDQPEVAISYFRRLLQLGLATPQVLCNVALACFYAGQYDVAMASLHKAMLGADDVTASDIWYNISHIAIRQGDLSLASQALQVSLSLNPHNLEALTNQAHVEGSRGNREKSEMLLAKLCARQDAPYEALYNYALLLRASGDLELCYAMARAALDAFPDFDEGKRLLVEVEGRLAEL